MSNDLDFTDALLNQHFRNEELEEQAEERGFNSAHEMLEHDKAEQKINQLEKDNNEN